MSISRVESHSGFVERTQVRLAHRVADLAALLSPWWRFRVWARLAGADAYANYDIAGEQRRNIWPHGSMMSLRQADWMERYALESGRYYQDDLIYTLLQEVHEGETFIDVGANVGFVTLTAAGLVGPHGRVISVEANASLVERLTRTLSTNQLHNVEVHNFALGAEDGEVALVTDGHHGTSHIDMSSRGEGLVKLRRGDDLVGDVRGPIFVKIDVEGAEQMVLEGFSGLVERADVRWLVEICESQLHRFGATPQGIFDTMTSAGYRAYSPRLSLLSKKVHLRPISQPEDRRLYDVYFSR